MMELNKFKLKRMNSVFRKCPALKWLIQSNNRHENTVLQLFANINDKCQTNLKIRCKFIHTVSKLDVKNKVRRLAFFTHKIFIQRCQTMIIQYMDIGLIFLIVTTVILLILGLGCFCLPCCTDIKCNNYFFPDCSGCIV